MNKTPSVFLRNPENMHEMTREVNPLCQWVLDGEGVATRKYDGTCVMYDGEQWWARREVKKDKTPPVNWVPVEFDDITGKAMGWEPIAQSGYYHAWQDAYINLDSRAYELGTYELIGSKINGNPERLTRNHELIKHGDAQRITVNVRNYDTIKADIQGFWVVHGWEGVVWHHPDGRMAKMKARDYKLEKVE